MRKLPPTLLSQVLHIRLSRPDRAVHAPQEPGQRAAVDRRQAGGHQADGGAPGRQHLLLRRQQVHIRADDLAGHHDAHGAPTRQPPLKDGPGREVWRVGGFVFI